MYILAVETTGKYGSAAVIDDDGRLFCASSDAEMNHLTGMISLIDEAVCKAGISKKDLTHIAASVGPGSFTGIRIGVVTARTMAQMLDVPCIGVSSLDGMALRVLDDAREKGCRYIVPLINARRHQTYAGSWMTFLPDDTIWREDPSEPMYVQKLEERQYMIEELLDVLSSGIAQPESAAGGREQSLKDMPGSTIYFTGDGVDAYKEIIESTLPEGVYIFANEELRYQHAGSIAMIALRKAGMGQVLGYNELMPEYMRLAEAEQRLRAGTLSDRIRKPVQI